VRIRISPLRFVLPATLSKMSSHAVRTSQATTFFTITSISALLSAAYPLLVSGVLPSGILPAHLAMMPLRMSSLHPLSQDPELNR
jgi:hypothetical protein